MKLNKILFQLVIPTAFTVMSCSDFKDTETPSPAADPNAVGANFPNASETVVVEPGEASFKMQLNRVNTAGAVDIDVEKVSCDKIGDVDFCTVPTKFSFADGEKTSVVTVPFLKDKCVFQQQYSMVLSIMDGVKDHPYAAGRTSTAVDFTVDYSWESIGNVVVKTKSIDKEPSTEDIVGQVAFEMASDFSNDDNQSLVRLNNVFASLPTGAEGDRGHIQFLVDSVDFDNPTILTSTHIKGVTIDKWLNTGYAHETLNTEDTKEEDMTMLYMKVVSISQAGLETTQNLEDKTETIKCDFTIVCDLVYSKVKDAGNIDDEPSDKFQRTLTFSLEYERPVKQNE